jgi:hypothetical protein
MTNFDERAREWDTPERRARAVRVARVIRESDQQGRNRQGRNRQGRNQA